MPAPFSDLWLRAPLLRGASVRHKSSDSLPGYSFNEVSPSFESYRLESFISLGHCKKYCTYERPLIWLIYTLRCLSDKHICMS